MIRCFPNFTIISIFKASKLQHESSFHRNLIKKEILIIENALIEEDKSFNNLRKMKYKAKELLKEIDDYIDFEYSFQHNEMRGNADEGDDLEEISLWDDDYDLDSVETNLKVQINIGFGYKF